MGYLGRTTSSGALTPWSACMLTRSTTLSIPSDGTNWTSVPFDVETRDLDGWHSTASNTDRITPVGFQGTMPFYVSAYVGWANNSTGIRRARIMKNGGTFVVQEVVAANVLASAPLNPSDFVLLAPGDYVTLEVLQDSGGALNLGATTTFALAPLPS